MTTIIVAGVAVVDLIFSVAEMPGKSEKYRADDASIVGGGCAANAAVAISRLGGKALLASRMGDDLVADIILKDLQDENVDLSLVHQAKGGKSSFSSIYVDKNGERQIMNFRGDNLIQNTSWLPNSLYADVILADNRWPPITEKMMSIAKKFDIPGIIDAEDPINIENLKNASHIAFSRQGLETLTGEEKLHRALKSVAGKLKSWICVTDGADGVYFLKNGNVEQIPGFNVNVKDTLGAGDIWHGAFSLCIAEGMEEISAINYANAVAAIKCTKPGGRAGCPDRQTTEQFLKEKTICS